MKLSIATLVASAMFVCAANAAPPEAPPSPKHRVVTCDQARPGTKLWKQCHKRAPSKVVKQHRAPSPSPRAEQREPAPRS